MSDDRELGRVFDDVPELYDRVRPGYPRALFDDLVRLTGIGPSGAVLEVGCGTGLATRGLAGVAGSVVAVEPGAGLIAVARRRLAGLDTVTLEQAAFEDWADGGRRFDLIAAASSWHWVDPSIGWGRAHTLLRPGGWLALLGHVVVRRPDQPELYAVTADLHERFAPGNPAWGHPPTEDEVRATSAGWGAVADPGALFGPTTTRWYATEQRLSGEGAADLLRSLSPYRTLPSDVREPLVEAIATRVRDELDDHVVRRYLTVLRVGQRRDTAS